MKTKRTSVVFQQGRARLYKGKKLIGTFEYQENQPIVDVIILGLAAKWSPLKRTLAKRAMEKLRRDQIKAFNKPFPLEAYRVQPRCAYITTSPMIAKLDVTDLREMLTVRP
ncbi:TPA: hypothetical protein NU463_004569 [Escherichia coli]|nr:hypothetical protein [Escherichia coli]HCJ9509006.1 hypothetical protein [Escherichia coli]HCJ9699631.1 hypothetical protein [Escherichia coli]